MIREKSTYQKNYVRRKELYQKLLAYGHSFPVVSFSFSSPDSIKMFLQVTNTVVYLYMLMASEICRMRKDEVEVNNFSEKNFYLLRIRFPVT